MAKKSKFTRAQIKTHIKKIQDAMEKRKREQKDKGEHFKSVTLEEIERKLKAVNSPFIIGVGLNHTTPGGTVNYPVDIYNPDATIQRFLFVHVWVGSGNIDPTVGTFLLNVDTRFPRLTLPLYDDGLEVASGTFGQLNFAVKVPTTVERTAYMGQSCLMQMTGFGIGRYLDRAMINFAVN